MIADAVCQVADEQERRLAAEAEAFNLEDGVSAVVWYATQSDPEVALRAYSRENPHIELSLPKLRRLAGADPYELAVGILRAMMPEPQPPGEPVGNCGTGASPLPPTTPSSDSARSQKRSGDPGPDLRVKLLVDTPNENGRRRTPTS